MKYYIIVGEASGDLHGSKLIKGIQENDPTAEFRFWGGDKMVEVAGEGSLVKHLKETSFMGFFEVAKNIRTVLSQISYCKKDILKFSPDAVILIDYAGFNLRIAKFTKALTIKTFYYISPKVWVWKESRVKALKKYVDELFVIFPFEVDYFKKWGIKAHYFGNPIMDAIEDRNKTLLSSSEFNAINGLDERPKIALLPGSRLNEINYNLPFMVDVARHFPEYQFVVCGVDWIEPSVYQKCINIAPELRIALLNDQTYASLAHSAAAIVTSGTATLETALLGTPEIVCYWIHPLTALVARVLIHIKWVSLVNIIMGKEVVRELIYKQMKVDTAVNELRYILPGGSKNLSMLADYKELSIKMGVPGASRRVAAEMVEILKRDNN